MSAESLRQRLREAHAPEEWKISVTRDLPEYGGGWLKRMQPIVIGPTEFRIQINAAELATDYYDMAVGRSSTHGDLQLIASAAADLKALLAFVDAFDAFQEARRMDDRGPALAQMEAARKAIEKLP